MPRQFALLHPFVTILRHVLIKTIKRYGCYPVLGTKLSENLNVKKHFIKSLSTTSFALFPCVKINASA